MSEDFEQLTVEEEEKLLAEYGPTNSIYYDMLGIDISALREKHLPSVREKNDAKVFSLTSAHDLVGHPETEQEKETEGPSEQWTDPNLLMPLEMTLLRHTQTTSCTDSILLSSALVETMQRLEEKRKSIGNEKPVDHLALEEERLQAELQQLIALGKEGERVVAEKLERHDPMDILIIQEFLKHWEEHEAVENRLLLQATESDDEEVVERKRPMNADAVESNSADWDDIEVPQDEEVEESVVQDGILSQLKKEFPAEVVKRLQMTDEERRQVDEARWKEESEDLVKRHQQQREVYQQMDACAHANPVESVAKEVRKQEEKVWGKEWVDNWATPNVKLLETIEKLEAKETEIQQQKELTTQQRQMIAGSARELQSTVSALAAPVTTRGLTGNNEDYGIFSQLKELLPGTEELVVEDLCEEPQHAKGKKKEKSSGVADMIKLNMRKEFLGEMEAMERQKMRSEDLKIQKEIRASEQKQQAFINAVSNAIEKETKGRQQVQTLESIAWMDIFTKHERQKDVIGQWLRHQFAEKVATETTTLIQNYDELTNSIFSIETSEWKDLIKNEESEGLELQRELLAIQEEEVRLFRAYVQTQQRRIFESWKSFKVNSSDLGLFTAALLLEDDGSISKSALLKLQQQTEWKENVSLRKFVSSLARKDTLHHQTACRQEWIQYAKPEVTALLPILSKATSQSSTSSGKPRPASSSAHAHKKRQQIQFATAKDVQLASEENQSLDELSTVLNPFLVLKHHPHWTTIQQRVSNFCLPHACRSLSITLEGVDSIDFKALQSAKEQEKLFSFALSAVHTLDLSSNVLSDMDVTALHLAIPALKKLVLSDNKFSVALNSCTTASENNEVKTAHETVQSLDISANKLSSLSGLQQFPGMTSLVAFSNCLDSSQQLEHLPRLSHLEVHRNNLKELNGAQHLPLLQVLDCSRNSISSISSLRKCILLDRLYASNNLIKELPSRLPFVFLRQLFLNDNQLSVLPEFCWLPCLQFLQLESNKITELRGLASCGMLSTLKLAFNQISRVEELNYLSACKRLTEVSLTDNPIASGASSKRSCRVKLLQMLPLLKEVDNEPIHPFEIILQQRLTYFCYLQQQFACRVHSHHPSHWSTHLAPGYALFQSPLANTRISDHPWMGTIGVAALHTPEVKRVDVNRIVSHSRAAQVAMYALDAQLQQIITTRDQMQIHHSRSLKEASMTEERSMSLLKRQRVGPSSLPLQAAKSSSEEQRAINLQKQLCQAEEQLFILRDSAMNMQSMLDCHVVSKSYARKAQQYKEHKAQSTLQKWIFDCVKIRAARRELQKLREQTQEYQTLKKTKAACRIQPVWRGAVTRKRLRRAKFEDDEVDMFQKVAWEDPVDHQNSQLSSFIQRAMQSHAGEQMPVFKNLDLEPRSLPQTQRPSSMPLKKESSHPTVGRNMTPNTSVLVPSSPNMLDRPNSNRPVPSSNVDSEWGAVTAQIKKRDKKFERQKADLQRKELMKDPLAHRQKK